MKKKIILILIISILAILIKYYYSDYSIEYKIDNYKIKSTYSNNRLYVEINNKYNFDYYVKRNKKKYIIKNIKEIKGEDFECVYPKIDNIKTYPLCIKDNKYIDYHLIESDLLNEYKDKNLIIDNYSKGLTYNKSLSKDEYIALWNYKGFNIINDKNNDDIELFKKERYENNLSYLYNDTIYIADYDNEHTFNKFILLNIKTKQKEEFELNYNINFDSYFVGSIGKYIYLYDNKDSNLYEINTKNKEIIIKYNNETGYEKYNGKEFISCSKSEYKINKISFDKNNSIYTYKYNKGYYKTIKDNKNISQLIFNDKIKILKENNNTLYYLNKNKIIRYSPSKGNDEIIYSNELEFNNDNIVFIYLDN